MPWTDTHTSIAYLLSPAGLVLGWKAGAWVRGALAKRDAKIASDAAATAKRHAEEAAWRGRMAADVTYVRDRVDEAHERISDVASEVSHVRGRLDGHGAAGKLRLAADGE